MSQHEGTAGVHARPNVHLAGAATRSYNVASVWETTAALSDEQQKLIDQVHACCTTRPVPAHVVDDVRFSRKSLDGTASAQQQQPGDGEAYVGTLDDAVLHNVNQFHKWHGELEAACASEMEEKYKRYADLLNSHLKTCEGILLQVDSTVSCFDSLLTQHKEVSQRSRSLHDSCEQLVREKQQLAEFADAIRTKLKFFDEFEQVSAQFQKVQLSLDDGQYLQLMQRLDDGLAYVASNPQYADASTYIMKFRQLQGKALGAVRNKVQQVFKTAVAQVQASMQEAQPKPTAGQVAATGNIPEGSEVSVLYVKFRTAAEPSLKGLLREIQARSQRPEYYRLLQECEALYCQARQQLLSPVLQQRLATELAGQALPLQTRAGCEQLLRTCQMEYQLFEQFFPGSRNAADALSGLVEPLSMLLYDMIRPQVVIMQDIEELCELLDVLKHEVLGDTVSRRGSGSEALRPMLERTVADVQGRIIFRCQAFIKEMVSAYVPTPADVDYPAKLQQAAPAPQAEPAASGTTNTVTDGSGQQPSKPGSTSDPYALLYPPLRATLVVLSKLYRAVDTKTFGGLAQEAVAACTNSVHAASKQVAVKAGALDAQLFMIKHLLFLREQIAPFDVEFAVTDVDLDFTHMREQMRRIMMGESSLFALGSNNAVVRMLGSGGPRVLTYQVDSKKELEKKLKSVCEAFIMAVTKMAVEPMLSFITKVTAVRTTQQAHSQGGAAGQRTLLALREQAFASPAKVAEVIQKVNDAMANQLPGAIQKMRLYLTNPSTHAILFKPVKSNIAEAHGQVATLVAAEYLPEEVASIPLKQPQELAALLDAMC